MRTLNIILTFLLISYINTATDSGCRAKENPTSFKDCKDLEVDPEEKYCCYVVLEDGTKECYPATEDDVEDLNNFQDELEQTYYKMEITTLKCQSNYLQFYVLSLLLILFIS